jgi:Na+-driven multidrug efflux pump
MTMTDYAPSAAHPGPAVPLTAPNRNQGRNQARATMILTAPVLPTILALAAPNLVVMLAQAVANLLESYYVGLIGVDALAGAALVFPLVMLMMMSGGGIGGGISSAVARSLGAGDHDKADALALHALVIAIGLGLASSLVVIVGGPMIYSAMGGEGQALAAVLIYSNVIFAGVVFLWVMNCLSAVLRGAGNMSLPAIVLTSGVVLLLVLSPALIFGFGPIPELGIAGAGLALTLYYLLATVISVTSLMRGRGGVHLSLKHPLQKTLFGEILGVGVWSSINTVLANLYVVVATFFVARTSMEAHATRARPSPQREPPLKRPAGIARLPSASPAVCPQARGHP